MHELDLRATAWIARRLAPAQRIAAHLTSAARWAGGWLWYALAAYLLVLTNVMPLASRTAGMLALAAIVAICGGILSTLK